MGPVLGVLTLYSPEDFEAKKNVVGRNFSIKLDPGGQVPEVFGVKLFMTMTPLKEYTVPLERESVLDLAYSQYPEELRGRECLALPINTKETWVQDDVIEDKYSGGKKVVYRLKNYNVPPGRWLLETITGKYFVEVKE
jgi:hypothetical protein